MARKIEIKTDRTGDYLEFIDSPYKATIIFEKRRFVFSQPIEIFNERQS
jgi:hypothetical protein